MDFQSDNRKESSPKFVDWLVKQSDRNDLVGDVSRDVVESIENGDFDSRPMFSDIWKYIESNFNTSNFFIQHNDSEPDFKRRKVEERLGRKLHDSYADSVSPLVCLQLAWDEYEQVVKRNSFLTLNKKDNTQSGYVYFIGLRGPSNQVKIGYSSKPNFLRRQKTIETSSPFDTVLLGFIESEGYKALEKKLHSELKSRKKKREWFELPVEKVKEIILRYEGTFIES